MLGLKAVYLHNLHAFGCCIPLLITCAQAGSDTLKPVMVVFFCHQLTSAYIYVAHVPMELFLYQLAHVPMCNFGSQLVGVWAQHTACVQFFMDMILQFAK